MLNGKIRQIKRLDFVEVCEMNTDDCSLDQIRAKFDRSRNVIWKLLHEDKEHRQA